MKKKKFGSILLVSAIGLTDGCAPGSTDAVAATTSGVNNDTAVQYSAKCMPSVAGPSTIPTSAFDKLAHQDLSEPVIRYLRCIDFDCTHSLQGVVGLGSAIVPQLSRLLLTGALPELSTELPGIPARNVRIKAATALGALNTPQALPPLVATLTSIDPLLRSEAARALGNFKFNHDALTGLLPLLRDPDPLVRETTAAALQKIACSAALPELKKALQTESAEHIRAVIIYAIHNLETP